MNDLAVIKALLNPTLLSSEAVRRLSIRKQKYVPLRKKLLKAPPPVQVSLR